VAGNGTYTKADRVAVQLQQIQAGTIVAPSPLTWARIWEFGDSALMIALQPRAVGQPFRAAASSSCVTVPE
jgi:hypothetical protein